VKKLRWVPDVIHCQGWMSAVVPLYVKTAYHDEPSFADAKVVTSLFSQKLDKNLGEDFKQCLEFRETTQELLKGYKDNFDLNELSRLAIDYSDGIVQSDSLVNDELLAYIKEKNIPFLGYSENVAEACEDFYESLYPAEE
jgi:starch synthase